MKKFLLLFCVAAAVAVALTVLRNPMAMEERFVRLQAQERFPAYADWLSDESAEVNALLLDYAAPDEGESDEALVLKAQAALVQDPARARRILPMYGSEPKFKDILRRHGENILPPIEFFLDNEITTISALHETSKIYERSKRAVEQLLNSGRASQSPLAGNAEKESGSESLSAEQRGWYAVNFIHAEGHDFLGQFVTDDSGATQWVQTERVLESLNSFFASGIRGLETKMRTEQEIAAGDLAWAAVDVALIGGAVKLLRAGKAASTAAKTANASTRTARGAAFTARLSRLGRSGLAAARYAKWPAIIATGYVLVKHPSLIGDLLAEAAAVFGMPVGLIQVAGWVLILLPLLYISSYIASWAVALLAGPLRAARVN